MPLSVRAALFVLGLVVLSGGFLLTESEAVQVVLFLALALGPISFAAKRYEASEDDERAHGMEPPSRILGLTLALLAPWLGATYVLSGEFELGAIFWMWALLWPMIEINGALTRRDIERNGFSDWSRPRPLREAIVYGIGTAAFIAVAVLLMGDSSLGEAILGGAACGAIVAVFGLIAYWIDRPTRAEG